MSSGIIVKVQHIRAALLCTSGARQWFERQELDWNVFLAEGLPVEVIEGTGDALAFRVSAVAREEQQ